MDEPAREPEAPPPSQRLCAAHGLVAGFDGRCVICRREEGGEDEAGPGRLIVGALLVFAMVAGGAMVLKGMRGRSRAAPEVVAPIVPIAPPAAEPEELAPPPPTPEEARGPARVANAEERARALEAAMLKVPVKMYAARGCDLCDTARAWMKDKKLSFTEVDVGADPAALEALARLSPEKKATVPTFDVDGEVLVGFGPPIMLGAVRRAAEKRLR